MKIKNIVIALTTLIVLFLCIWLGASIYVGRTTGQLINNLIAQSSSQRPIRFVNLQHDQSLFSSKGQFEVRFNDIPIDMATGKQELALVVNYQVQNLLLPASAMRFVWGLKPAGEIGTELNRLFGSEIALNGKGKVAYGGKSLTSLNMPELVANNGKDKLQISPSTGFLTWQGNAVALDWKTDRIAFNGEDQTVEINGLSVVSDLQNRKRGIGTVQFSLGKLSTKEGTLQGYSLKTIGAERGDRLDVQINQKLDSISVANQKFSNILLDLSITNLDLKSMDVLSDLADNSDDIQNLTDDQKQRAVSAGRKLLEQGFTIALPKISAEYGKGSVDGKLTLEVIKAEPNQTQFDVSKSVRASGELNGKGRLLDQSQKAMALMFGIATETKEGLKASFEFAGTKLKANGKTHDVSSNIVYLNEMINSLLYP